MFSNREMIILIEYDSKEELYKHIDNLLEMFKVLRYSRPLGYRRERKYVIVIADGILFERPANEVSRTNKVDYKELKAISKQGKPVCYEYELTNLSKEDFFKGLDKLIEKEKLPEESKNVVNGSDVNKVYYGAEGNFVVNERQPYGQGINAHNIQVQVNELYNQVMDGVRNQLQA